MNAEAQRHNAGEMLYGPELDAAAFVIQALDDGDGGRARDLLRGMHAADIARLLNIAATDHRQHLILLMEDVFSPHILPDLETPVQEDVVRLLGAEKIAELLAKLEPDDAVYAIEDMDAGLREEILAAMPPEASGPLKEGLAYPEDTAGRLMDKGFVALPEDWTVGQTIDHLRRTEDLPDDFDAVFVVDKEGRPIGAAQVSRVIRRKRDVALKDIMKTDIRTIPLNTDQEEIAYLFQKYGLSSAPVVNERGVMVARITLDDILDVVEEEAEEDIMHLAGVSVSDLHANAFRTAFHRFPWLFVNVITAALSSTMIWLFQGEIEKLVMLAVLMPIVASMAGNAGTQTLAVIVRAIATKEITAANAMRVAGKEILTAMTNGALLGIVQAAVSFLVLRDAHLSLVFGSAAFAALSISGIIGVSIPLLLARLGADPAVASGVFITAITDSSSFFIFLGLASIYL